MRSGRREELDAPLVSSYARLFVTFMSTLYPLIHKKLHYILEIFLTNMIVVCNYMEFIKNRFVTTMELKVIYYLEDKIMRLAMQ